MTETMQRRDGGPRMQAIPACTVDCGKWDSDDTSDFGFFDKLNTVNVITRHHAPRTFLPPPPQLSQ